LGGSPVGARAKHLRKICSINDKWCTYLDNKPLRSIVGAIVALFGLVMIFAGIAFARAHEAPYGLAGLILFFAGSFFIMGGIAIYTWGKVPSATQQEKKDMDTTIKYRVRAVESREYIKQKIADARIGELIAGIIAFAGFVILIIGFTYGSAWIDQSVNPRIMFGMLIPGFFITFFFLFVFVCFNKMKEEYEEKLLRISRKFCKKCGKQVEQDFNVCPYCGKKLTK